MLEGMSATEFREWEAMYRLDPWGPERADLRSGIECSVMDACHRTKGHVKPPKDYMVDFDPSPQQQAKKDADMKAKFKGFSAKVGRLRSKRSK